MEETTEERDSQAALVATSFVTTAGAYFELTDRLRELDEPTADELETVRIEASALTARTAQLLREARNGLLAHEDHGCWYENVYEELTGFLGILMESGANLLELHDAEQIDRGSLLHPFAHFIPMLGGAVGPWLQAHADEEVQEKLAEFIDNADAIREETAFHPLRLVFGPLDEETLEALHDWFEAGGPDTGAEIAEPLAALVGARLEEIHDVAHEDPHASAISFGQEGDSTVFLNGDFEAFVVGPLLEMLEEVEVGYRLIAQDRLDEASVSVWAPPMSLSLTRRALIPGGLRYQIDADELAALRAAGADLDDIADYLTLDLFPAEDESAALRLGELAELVASASDDETA